MAMMETRIKVFSGMKMKHMKKATLVIYESVPARIILSVFMNFRLPSRSIIISRMIIIKMIMLILAPTIVPVDECNR